MKPLLMMAAAAVLFTACAGTGGSKSAADAAEAASAINTVPVEGLPPQRLEPGQCGLFLWGMSAPRRFVFFTEGTAGKALVLVNDAAVSMPMTTAGGEVFGQFLTLMKFEAAETGSSVTVTINPGVALEGGQRVDSGNILFKDAEGWETVLPITGVRACMPG
jgi:hypothetical protein